MKKKFSGENFFFLKKSQTKAKTLDKQTNKITKCVKKICKEIRKWAYSQEGEESIETDSSTMQMLVDEDFKHL